MTRRSQAWRALHADMLADLARARREEGAADFRTGHNENPYRAGSDAALEWAKGFRWTHELAAIDAPADAPADKHTRHREAARQFALTGDRP